tara:strand:+ start:129 stop:488 length:360 start_codon:yes stop_codon:yes gene_type:complete
MKKIEVTIMPNKLKPVLNALAASGFNKLTYFEAKGQNQKQGERKMWRGQEYREIYGRIIQMTVIVEDKDINRLIDIIKNASKDEDYENIICITEVEDLIKSRIEEKNVEILAYSSREVI